MEETNWSRVAEPQPDGYPINIIRRHARGRWGYEAPEMEEPTFLDGQVMIRPCPSAIRTDIDDAPPDHPAISDAERLLWAWPEAYLEIAELVDGVYPLAMEDRTYPASAGCVCGRGPDFCTVYATTYDPIGFCEGIVHELGHWKLIALGVRLEEWDALLENDPGETTESPVRKDKPRPAGAVLHAHYSYVSLTQLDTKIYHHFAPDGPDPDPNFHDMVLNNLSMNLPRIVEGQETIPAFCRGDSRGQPWIDSLVEWGDRVVAEGREILEREGRLDG